MIKSIAAKAILTSKFKSDMNLLLLMTSFRELCVRWATLLVHTLPLIG